jgi:hypothetical protein
MLFIPVEANIALAPTGEGRALQIMLQNVLLVISLTI